MKELPDSVGSFAVPTVTREKAMVQELPEAFEKVLEEQKKWQK